MPAFRLPISQPIIMVALCAALALASGCSALRLGYAAAPEAAYWWLDGHADFNDEQSPRVRDALAQWFAWHRRTQLPDYAALLARVQPELAGDTTAQRACAWQAEVLQRARPAFERAAPAAADMMLTLSAEQLRRIEQRHAKANAEFRDEYLQSDSRKRSQNANKRTVERVESVYGTLDDAQRGRIAETLARSPFDPERWFAERRQRQQGWLEMLRKLGATAAGRDQAQAALRGYIDDLERSPRDAYRRYAQQVNEFNCAFAADVHNAMTAAQRRHAAQKLAGWEADLRALVGTGVPVATN